MTTLEDPYAPMLGDELRRRRRALDLTQKQLAEALEVQPNTLACWERGAKRIVRPAMLRAALAQLEQVYSKPRRRS